MANNNHNTGTLTKPIYSILTANWKPEGVSERTSIIYPSDQIVIIPAKPVSILAPGAGWRRQKNTASVPEIKTEAIKAARYSMYPII